MTPRVSAVVLAYGPEPWLGRCIEGVLASEGVDVDVVLVDNGGADETVSTFVGRDRVRIVGSGTNLGFSGGCDLGVAASDGDYVALVNGDLVVDPDALARLVEVAADPAIGIAAGSVRLSSDRELLNSSGNAVHFLGFSWVEGFELPAATHAIDRDVAGAMGALVVLRREVWDDLGGFPEQFFAFHEDADLSWRAWQRGLRVHYVPEAIGVHRYEFGREGSKMYLAERNRWIFVLGCWDGRTLALLAPAFLAMEVAIAAAAAAGGWFGDKRRGWVWLWRNRRWLAERRRQVQADRRRTDRELAPLMAVRMDARNFELPEWARPFDVALGWYWRVVRRLLR